MTKNVKFGFYVSGNATRLTKYLSTCEDHMEIQCVVHDGAESSELKEVLLKNEIPYFHVELGAGSMEDKSQRLSDALLSQLLSHSVDYCFCFGSKILKGELLERFFERIINFHPSLLPSFPGVKSIDQALEYGAIILGNTAHIIDEGVDTGAIIMQSMIEASRLDGYDSVLDLQIPMLHQISKWICDGRFQVCGRNVTIKDAIAGNGRFIPALEH
jgi:phosphoribosylglycinamide formyltransferase 1